MKTDITYMSDIEHLVNEFYAKIRKDELLGEIFENRIQDRWPEHLDKMYRFWQTVLLEEHTYNGSPFRPHANMPVQTEHFDRWMKLFTETVDENFQGDRARKALWQGERMAHMFNHKIDYFRKNTNVPLL